MPTDQKEPIAIIGTGCRFPGSCNTVSKLWDLLKEPYDVAQDIPTDRFNIDRFYHRNGNHHGTTNVRQSYFLTEDVTRFDNKFFAIPPAEAAAIDPQQRLLLEVTYESMESAGYPLNSLTGSDTAVYVGIMCDDYKLQQAQDLDFLPTYNATGTANSNASSRMSYYFDWHGPSMTIDTACSSSLVAVNQAVQALRNGTTTVAFAAGTNLILYPFAYVAESNLNMLSPDGRSKMWDAAANGYARGEGVAAIMMKTLSAAIADGDEIECVIRDVGLNHDGRTTGLTMPSATAQAALIRQVYKNAGLDPDNRLDRCQYFEAHGTGTPAGDPQEAEALSKAFFQGAAYSEEDLIYVGSIKTVIGHTEGTAGLAGILKACMALKHGFIPPNLQFHNLNPKLEPFVRHLKITTAALPWPAVPDGAPRRASVNSFGFGGANAHVILETYQPSSQVSKIVNGTNTRARDIPVIPFVFTAASQESLTAYLAKFIDFLESNSGVHAPALAHALFTRKSVLPYRAAFASGTVLELVKAMADATDDKASKTIGSSKGKKPSILGVFTGQGAQWATMGRGLISAVAPARKIIDDLDQSLRSLPEKERPNCSLLEELSATDASRVRQAEISQPLCTAVQVMIVDLLVAAGVQFTAVVGHSSGEIGAAYAAGLLNKADAIRVAYYRGYFAKLAKGTDGTQGAMMAVGTSLEDAQSICELDEFQGRLSVAAQNSPSSVTLSGDLDAIRGAKAIFDEEKKFARQLEVDIAYHSPHMMVCAQAYAQALRECKIKVRQPSNEAPVWFSSVNGKLDSSSEAALGNDRIMPIEDLNCQYWVDNMTKPVLFYGALCSSVRHVAKGFNFAMEVGPHPALKGPAIETLKAVCDEVPEYSGTLSRGKDDVEAFRTSLGSLWAAFGPDAVNLAAFEKTAYGDDHEYERVPLLPTYAWHHDRPLWAEARSYKSHRSQNDSFHDLLGRLTSDSTATQWRWHNVLHVKELPWLTGHALQGQTVFPATAYVALAMEAAVQIAGDRPVTCIELCNLDIVKAIAISDNAGTELRVSMTNVMEANQEKHANITADFVVHSTVASLSSGSLGLNCHGQIRIVLQMAGQADTEVLCPRASPLVNMSEVDVEHFYTTLREDIGYVYEGPFQSITHLERRLGLSSGSIKNPQLDGGATSLLFHPALADCALQGMFATVSAPGDGMISSIRVPKGCRRVTVVPALCGQSMPDEVAFECTMTDSRSDMMPGDVDIYTPNDGRKIIEFEGLTFAPFTAATSQDDRCLFQESVWLVDEPNGALVVGERRPTAEQKQKALDAERAAFFYLKNAHLSVDKSVRSSLPWHRQALLEYAKKVYDEVCDRRHTYANDWLGDTHEQIIDMMDDYGDDADFNLTRAVGENILRAEVLNGNENILEYMTENDYLTRYYEKAAGFEFLNESVGRMMVQLTNKYPHMHICEVGAGTGGATKAILDQVGQNFDSYTYTDISSGFFEAAQEKLKGHTQNMNFKTLNVENDPTKQGFSEGSYDCVIAANVLHATKSLEDTMRNVRRLLKPGGRLVLFEVINNDVMRFGAVMGGLPGWWVGRDDGRRYAPTISLEQWDSLFKRTAFSGVDTYTPMFDPIAIPQSIFCTMAVNDEVNVLRDPVSTVPKTPLTESLVIFGGQSNSVGLAVDRLLHVLKDHFRKVVVVETLDNLSALPPNSHILALADCNGSIFDDMSASRWKSLQTLLEAPKSILWVTHAAYQDNSYAGMSIGLVRNLFYELLGIAVHLLDFPDGEYVDYAAIAKLMLQIRFMADLKAQDSLDEITWTVESELRVHDGKLEMLRVRPQEKQNARLNSTRRPITQLMDISAHAIRLQPRSGVYALVEDQLPALDAEGAMVAVKLTTSLLSSIRTTAGFAFVCLGIDIQTGKTLLFLSNTNASQIVVHKSWTVPIDGSIVDRQYMSIVVGFLILRELLRVVPGTGSLVAHELNAGLASLLSKELLERGQLASFTSSDPDVRFHHGNWTHLHERSTHRSIISALPTEISCFIDASIGVSNLSHRMKAALPSYCHQFELASIFGDSASLLPNVAPENIRAMLREISAAASGLSNGIPDGTPLDTMTLHTATVSPVSNVTLIDWTAERRAWVSVRPVSSRQDLFRDDVTYWLAGLSGDLGRSITDFMIDHGARHVALSSRRPPIDESWVQWHKSKGAQVSYFECDLTDFVSVENTFNQINQAMPRVGGVGNGAMVLRDGVFSQMSLEDFQCVTRPKVEGTVNLLRLFEGREETPLDWFIAFSSFVATRGNPGQANYAAANCCMKALINQRRSHGLAASSVDISRVVGVGYVDRELKIEGRLTKEQKDRLVTGSMSLPMSESDLHQAFAEAIIAGRSGSDMNTEIITGIAPVSRETANMSLWPGNPKFGLLVRDESKVVIETVTQTAQVPVKKLLQEAHTMEEVGVTVKSALTAKLRSALFFSASDTLHDTTPLIDIGVDSLVGVEIRGWCLKELAVDIPVMRILGGISIEELAEEILSSMQGAWTKNISIPSASAAATVDVTPEVVGSATTSNAAEIAVSA